jgi:Nif-specific regulatory protein
MPDPANAFLVIRHDDGFGDVFELAQEQRYTMGRAQTNRIVLKDEVCSREHAEVYYTDGRWRLRDLNSLNGTRINGDRLDSEWELSPLDEISVGRTTLVFAENLDDLPEMPMTPVQPESVTIKKRLRHTRFLTPVPPIPIPADGTPHDGALSRRISHDLSLLYRLTVEMGAASSFQDLAQIVLSGLLEATPAHAGAVYVRKDGRGLDLTEHRHKDPKVHPHGRVSQFLSNEVLQTGEAILAEDVEQHPDLQNRKSILDVGATSVICAPFSFNERVLGLIHLYCTDSAHGLDADDLEFVTAVARQMGAAAHQLMRQASLAAENVALRAQLRIESEMVGNSQSLRKIEQQIGMVAGTNATVLVRGESGTGKELVARAIHYSSPRKDGPFVCLNCAALPESLLESELFGHEKGAFTGATEKKVGKFEAADRGTIFLDEIGELKPGTQAKLLRILEGHPFERVGGHTPIRVDTRVVAATNQPLEDRVRSGEFRRDLFFRLQVVELKLPPLRDRREDIPLLADHFLKRYARETSRKAVGFTPSALKKMQEYDWPGNIRELRNVIERAVALGLGPTLDASDIWLSSLEVGDKPIESRAAYQAFTLEEIEKRHIKDTLEHTDWNKSQAAAILQIERSTLDRKIKSYDLQRNER